MRHNFLSVLKKHTVNTPLKFTDIEKRFRVPNKKFGLYMRGLMLKGVPVCLTRTGYFLASEHKQAKPTIDLLKYKAAIFLKAASAIEKSFEHNGQQKLF